MKVVLDMKANGIFLHNLLARLPSGQADLSLYLTLVMRTEMAALKTGMTALKATLAALRFAVIVLARLLWFLMAFREMVRWARANYHPLVSYNKTLEGTRKPLTGSRRPGHVKIAAPATPLQWSMLDQVVDTNGMRRDFCAPGLEQSRLWPDRRCLSPISLQ